MRPSAVVEVPVWQGWIAIAWAIPFDLPETEDSSAWTPVLELGGFEPGEYPEAGPAVALDSGEPWMLRVRDDLGHERSAPVEAPLNTDEREDIVWLAKSLLQPELTTDPLTKDPLQLPIPKRGRSIVPEWPRNFWFRFNPALALRPGIGPSASFSMEVGGQVFDVWNLSLAFRPQTPSGITRISSGESRESTFSVLASRLYGQRALKAGIAFGPGLSGRRITTDTSSVDLRMVGPVLSAQVFAHWELPWVQLEPTFRVDLDLFGTVVSNGTNSKTLSPLQFSFGIAARIGLPPQRRSPR